MISPTAFWPNRFSLLLLLLAALPLPVSAPFAGGSALSLRSETLQAFDLYIAQTQAKNSQDFKSPNFLWIDETDPAAKAEAYAKLKRGDVLLRRISNKNQKAEIPYGLIHDWQGMIFIPGARLDNVLTFLEDYDHQATYFAPDVERSKIDEHQGDHYRVFLRFRRRNIITVVLNTEHDITYFRDSPTRAHSRSSATRIAEVDNPGEPSEKEKTPGQDNGFLWRMETWWRMEEKDGGVYVQNQVVSLTRDIPMGLGWAVEPFITTIPKESLELTLNSVRRAVVGKLRSRQDYPLRPVPADAIRSNAAVFE